MGRLTQEITSRMLFLEKPQNASLLNLDMSPPPVLKVHLGPERF